jgi:TPM domain
MHRRDIRAGSFRTGGEIAQFESRKAIMKNRLLPVVLLSLLCMAGAPSAVAERGVKDNADFFSERAEQQANQTIDQIFQKHRGKEVLIETLEAAPAGQTPGEYADTRIGSGVVNGLYVLVVKKGGQVSVRAGSDTRKLFTDNETRRVAQQIDAGLRKGRGNWDQTLVDAVASINTTFAGGERAYDDAARSGSGAGAAAGGARSGQSGGAPTAPRRGFFSGIWGWVCLGIGALIIFNIVRGISRARSAGHGGGGYGGGYPPGGGGNAPGPGGGYGGGGGGWGSSILGGLLGGAAGSWMYDRMFRGGSTHAAPPDAGGGADYGGGGGGVPPQSDWGGQDVPGGGFSSGDAGGGGDYGGGGGGGGDVGGGGGDVGGGGDYA